MLFFKATDVYEADAVLTKGWVDPMVIDADYASPPTRYHHKFLS